MKPFRRLSILLMVLLLSAAGLIGGPTWMAHALADGRRVERVAGPPTATLFGVPIYHAGSVSGFRVKGDRAPGTYAAGFALTFGGPLLGGLLAIGISTLARPVPEAVGRDKWMTKRGAKKAGLLAGDGVICGKIGGTTLAYDGPEHHLVSGASRSGKGVGHVIPTLLCWSRSALIYDVKGELWEATAGYRGTFGHCSGHRPQRHAVEAAGGVESARRRAGFLAAGTVGIRSFCRAAAGLDRRPTSAAWRIDPRGCVREPTGGAAATCRAARANDPALTRAADHQRLRLPAGNPPRRRIRSGRNLPVPASGRGRPSSPVTAIPAPHRRTQPSAASAAARSSASRRPWARARRASRSSTSSRPESDAPAPGLPAHLLLIPNPGRHRRADVLPRPARPDRRRRFVQTTSPILVYHASVLARPRLAAHPRQFRTGSG